MNYVYGKKPTSLESRCQIRKRLRITINLPEEALNGNENTHCIIEVPTSSV